MSDKNSDITDTARPTDWPAVFWFHVPVILIGGLLLIPTCLLLLADAGAFGQASDRMAAKATERMFIGVVSILPVVYAFGTELRFSIGRYLAAVVLVAFMQLSAMVSSGASGNVPAVISLGGGALGIASGFVLGYGGLKLRDYWRAVTSVKVVIIAVAACFVGFLVVAFAQQAYVNARDEADRMARAVERDALRERYWQDLMEELQRTDSSVLTMDQVRDMSGSRLIWRQHETFELSAKLPPCVEVNFGASRERQPYFDSLETVKDEFEAALGNTVTWISPSRNKAYAGGGVSERDVADLPSFWTNGGARSCLHRGNSANEALEDTQNWPQQHEWIARQLESFYQFLGSEALQTN